MNEFVHISNPTVINSIKMFIDKMVREQGNQMRVQKDEFTTIVRAAEIDGERKFIDALKDRLDSLLIN